MGSLGPMFHRNYSIINNDITPADLSISRLACLSFNVITSDNDCNSLPSVGMLGASKMFIARLQLLLQSWNEGLSPRSPYRN